MASPTDSALDALRAALPSDAIVTDADECREFGTDRTRVFTPNASAVLFPRTTVEVQAIVRAASANGVPVVPSGGRTGYAGGAVATNGELVVSLSKMRHMGAVDTAGATVTVQAGAVTQAVHDHVAQHGFTWPIDFASKGSSQVGGNIATNAGGVKVLRYGLTRQWVLGLEVVLADGSVIRPGGALEKNNTGLDLKQLFIGTEGTLGIITGATLKLVPLPQKLDVLLFALQDMELVISLFEATRKGPFRVMAYEFFTQSCFLRTQQHLGARLPFAEPASHYVLLEVEDADAAPTEAWLAGLFDSGLVVDGVLAQHPAQAAELWRLREGISESLAATGLPHKNDIALPIAALTAFSAELAFLLNTRYPNWEVNIFGHVGDGNLHVNIMKPDELSKDAFLTKTADTDKAVFELVRKHGGSISAEHGIGLLKKPYLGFSRTPEEIAAMKAIKRQLDPKNIFNPGKIFDL